MKYVVWVYEPKWRCIWVILGDEMDAGKVAVPEAMRAREIKLEPTHPEEVNLVPHVSSMGHTRPIITDIDMENIKHTGIPIRMKVRVGIISEDHYIWMGAWIDGVLVLLHVVGCVVDVENLVAVNALV